jgi:iron complex outermembrane recepter protein
MAFVSNAQCNYTLKGSVLNSNKKAIANAIVTIVNTGFNTTTTTSGTFSIDSICNATIQIKIFAVGYTTQQQTIVLTNNNTLNIVLQEASTTLNEVIVSGYTISKQTNIQQELKAKDVEATRGLTFADAVANANGVTLLQTGSSIAKPVIHGLHSSRILIVNNGIRQEGQQWGSEHAPEVDPFIADKIIVLKGAGALQYGSDAIGGAILVEPKTLPSQYKLQTTLNTGYFTNNRMGVLNAIFENTFKKNNNIAWRLQASTRYGGNSKTPNYWLHNTGLQEYNASGMFGIKGKKSNIELFASIFNTQLGIFWGSQIGSLSDLNAAINRKEPLFNINSFTYTIDRPKQNVQHIVTKAKYNYIIDSSKQFNLLISHQENKRQEYDLARITDLPELDLRIGSTLADANFSFTKKKLTHTVGVNYMLQRNVWAGSRFFIPNFNSNNVAVYAISKYNALKQDAELGIRFDYKNLTSFRNANNIITSQFQQWNGVSATSGYSIKFSARVQWLFNAALAWRAPNVSELYTNGLHHGTSSFEIGNPNLATEQAYNFGTQLRWKLHDSLFFADIGLYNNYINGFINLIPDTPATLTIRGAFPTFKYVQTNAQLSGMDATIGSMINKQLMVVVKATLLAARDKSNNTWLAQMPSNRLTTQVQYSFANGKKLYNSSIKMHTQTVFTQHNLPTNNTDYLLPPPTYTLVGFDASTTTNLAKNPFTIGISVMNALNTVYREYMNRFRYFADETGINIAVRLKYTL